MKNRVSVVNSIFNTLLAFSLVLFLIMGANVKTMAQTPVMKVGKISNPGGGPLQALKQASLYYDGVYNPECVSIGSVTGLLQIESEVVCTMVDVHLELETTTGISLFSGQIASFIPPNGATTVMFPLAGLTSGGSYTVVANISYTYEEACDAASDETHEPMNLQGNFPLNICSPSSSSKS